MYKIVDEIEKKAQEAGPEKYQETLKELSNKELEKQTGKNKDKLKELFDLRFTKSADDLLKAAKEDKPSIAKELVQELEKDARVAFLTKHFPLSPELAILFLRAMETSPPAAGKALGELVYSLDKAQREALIKAIKENAEKDKTNPMFNTLLKWVDSKETENKHTDKATSSKFAEAYDKQVEDKKKANEAYWKTVEDLDKNAAEIAKAEPAKVKELQEQRAKKQEELKPFEEASSTFARFNVSETNDKNKDNALTNGSRTAMAFADVSSEGKAWLNLAPEAITPGNRKPSRLFLGTVDKDKPGEVLKTAAGALSKFDSNRDEGDLNKFRVVKKHPEAVTPNPVYIDKGGNFKKEKPTELASKEFKPTVTAPPTATPPPATPPPKKEEPKTGLTDAEKALVSHE
jgi:ribosomal protein L29